MHGLCRVVIRFFSLLSILLFSNSTRAEGVAAGDRVRVEYAGGTIDGRLVSVNDDVVVVETNGIATASTIQRSSITDFERLDGKKTNGASGLFIGAATGLAIGSIVASQDEPDPDEFITVDTDGYTMFAFAVIGALLGTAIGLSIESDRWTDVPLDSTARLGLEPSLDRGVVLNLTYDF